jgi:carboxyl-terminal processing protease
MKRLVLDLRSNPGGQLDQAIRITNRFVPKGSMVVYTRGRVPNSDQDYRATDTPEYTDIPMITLVNRSSASASEIVSGALQDFDRSLIIGETTFGKALVQSVYRVSGGAGLALTTARYYTPSGRLIQRPWDGTFDEYLTYTMKDQSARTHSPQQLKYTTGGRKVYSGGGIEPDERFDGPLEGFNPTRFGRSIFNRGLFASFAEQFYFEGDARPGARANGFKYVKRNFEVTPAMIDEFKAFVAGRNVKIDEEAWAKDAEFIRAMVRFEIDQAVFDIARQRLVADPQAGSPPTSLKREAELTRSRSGRAVDPKSWVNLPPCYNGKGLLDWPAVSLSADLSCASNVSKFLVSSPFPTDPSSRSTRGSPRSSVRTAAVRATSPTP